MRARVGWLLPIALAAIDAVVLGTLSVWQRRTLFQFDEDLAIYDQVVWNTAHGRLFASTLIEHADNLLGDHFSPIVAVFAPIYWVVPSPNVLLIGQAVALAIGVLPLWRFARERLGVVAAGLVAVAYVLYPALHHVALFQFHEIALIVAPLMLAMLALERGQRALFLVAACLCLAVKEEAAIVVACLGLLWWLRRRSLWMAAGTVGLAVVVGILALGVLLPSLNTADAGSGYYYVRRYAQLGGTPVEMAVNAVLHPELWATADRLRFVVQLAAPLLFVSLVGWEYVVASIPVFGYLLLANSPDQYSIDRHYLAPLVPFFFFGAVLGLSRLAAATALPLGEGRLRASPAALVAAACLVGAFVLRPAPVLAVTDHTLELRRLVEQVPAGASVSASRNLLSPFSRRERVFRFPVLGQADYVLLDFRELRHPAAFGLDGGAFGRLVESPEYRMLDSAAGAVLFQRGDPAEPPFVGPGAPVRFAEPPLASTASPVAIDLLGARANRVQDGVEAALVWRAVGRVPRPYTVFVHVFDASGKRIAQADAPPVDGLLPTDTWPPGHVVVDRHRVPTPPGAVKLQIGLYDSSTGRRLAPDLVELAIP